MRSIAAGCMHVAFRLSKLAGIINLKTFKLKLYPAREVRFYLNSTSIGVLTLVILGN